MSSEHERRMLSGQSRRGFLESSLGWLTAGLGLPAWHAKELLAAHQEAAATRRPVAPSDQIQIGAIGTGGRGTNILLTAARLPGVKVVAVCDVDASHRAKAARSLPNNGDVRLHEDFREVVNHPDIQAVLIGTPDHWHALIALAALEKGKDVYCEKPLTLTIAEGAPLIRAARAGGRVFQVGSQQRSDARFRLACELVRNDRLGAIERVETFIGTNPTGGPFATKPVPEGLNWDLWQGPTPAVPFIPERCHNTFRWWSEYSGGKLTDWGAHHNDIAQWGLGTETTGPVAVEAESTPLEHPGRTDCYNFPSDFRVTYAYADGRKLICRGKGENGVIFRGQRGWIFVSRRTIRASDPKLIEEPLPKDAQRLSLSTNHMKNFFDCVKSREKPICDVEIGHRSVSVCHLGNIAIRVGKPLQWDPAKESFHGANADAANALVSRPMRGPWKLPT